MAAEIGALQRNAARSPIVLTANSCWNIVNFRSGLLDELAAAGHPVEVLAPLDDHAQKLVQRGIPLSSLRIDNKGLSPRRDARLFLDYRRELRRIGPAALLSFTIKPNIYGSLAAASLGIPVINNISGLGTAFLRGGWLERLVGRLYRAALRRSATVFFQNADDKALFERRGLVGPDQARLLNGSGVDLDAFTPRPGALPATGPAPTFLLIARMLWDKGVGEFVAAARIVRERLPGARFQLLGPLGADNRSAVPRAEVDAWVAEGVVDYLGEQADVRPFLAAADCVVLPSYREGLPRTLIEAAAMGRPAIATDVPGCRAAIDDGVTGLLCAPRSAESLAQTMLRFAALPPSAREKMASAARKMAVEAFDQRAVAAAYLAALDRAGVPPSAAGQD